MVKGRSIPSPDPRANQLLASLPEPDYQSLAVQLERVPMPLGMAVYESGGAQGFVYFPADSIVSLLYVLEDGASTEIAVTGNEGLVGISLFMGGESTPSRAVVQSAGHGYRVRGTALKKLFESSGSVQHLLLHAAAGLEELLQGRAAHAVAVAGALHHGAARRALAAHEERDAHQPLVAGDRDLGGGAILEDVQQRDDAVGREVHEALRAAGLVDRHAERHRNTL